MKLKARLSGQDHEVSLHLEKHQAEVEVDGRPYEIEVRQLAYGEYLIVAGSNVYRCRVEAKRDSRTSFEVVTRGKSYEVRLFDPKRLRSAQSSEAHDAGDAQIISPMAGKVVRVLVEAGAEVKAGAGIVVVEAMKMQNEMKAPKDGVVVSVNAKAGDTVNAGEVLAVIE